MLLMLLSLIISEAPIKINKSADFIISVAKSSLPGNIQIKKPNVPRHYTLGSAKNLL